LILTREEIRRLIEEGMIEGYVDLHAQLQPSGFDLTVREVSAFLTRGFLGFRDRDLPQTRPIFWGEGPIRLSQGCYLVTYNEYVRIPNDICAVARPRSSLLRMGGSLLSAVWDPGYQGRSRSLLVVFNEHGLDIARNARICQLVFLRLSRPTSPYRGVYLGER